MIELLELFAETFSFVEIISFIWVYIFSKSYRKRFSEKWNQGKVGLEWESKTILIIGIIFSTIFNFIIIGTIIYYSFFN